MTEKKGGMIGAILAQKRAKKTVSLGDAVGRLDVDDSKLREIVSGLGVPANAAQGTWLFDKHDRNMQLLRAMGLTAQQTAVVGLFVDSVSQSANMSHDELWDWVLQQCAESGDVDELIESLRHPGWAIARKLGKR